MKFARIVYWIAATYGFLVLTPFYFLFDRVGRDSPPPVTHPELYYGFFGVGLVWQLAFVLVAADPVRYRPLMLITILEKLVYTIPVIVLYAHGRVPKNVLQPSLVDPVFGMLFFIAYLKTGAAEATPVWRSADSN